MALDAHDETSDEALMILYANGDRAAAHALTRRITPRVMAYAYRLLSGDRAEAEDVAQETMLRLWRVAPDWRQGEAKVVTWAYRVATNLCMDRLRSLRRRGRTPLEDAPEVADPAVGPIDRMVDVDRTSALHAAMAQLPDRQRQAVILRHIEGMFGPFSEALSREDRRALRSAFLDRAPEFRAGRKDAEAEFSAAIAALRADPFDPAALQLALASIEKRNADRLALGKTLIEDRIIQLSDAERLAFADRLESALTRGDRRTP